MQLQYWPDFFPGSCRRCSVLYLPSKQANIGFFSSKDFSSFTLTLAHHTGHLMLTVWCLILGLHAPVQLQTPVQLSRCYLRNQATSITSNVFVVGDYGRVKGVTCFFGWWASSHKAQLALINYEEIEPCVFRKSWIISEGQPCPNSSWLIHVKIRYISWHKEFYRVVRGRQECWSTEKIGFQQLFSGLFYQWGCVYAAAKENVVQQQQQQLF